MDGFIGRAKELSLLEKEYSKGSDLILVTGRRRVGKTRLLKEFMKGKDAVYYLATNEAETDMLKDFWDTVRPEGSMGIPENWKQVFSSLVDGKRKLLVIDEFSYMVKMSSSFLVRFQGIYDEILKGSGITTVLCGSHMSIMNRLSEDVGGPLYGRFDRRIVLKPLPFDDIPSSGDIRRDIELYSLHGGVPRYMELLDPVSPRENVIVNIMEPNSMMFGDPLLLLQTDAGDSNVYLSILRAVANGGHRSIDISSALEMPAGRLSPYLMRLMEIGMLRKEFPVFEKNEDSSKLGRYFLEDRFIQFWFRFVYPYRSALVRGEDTYAISRFDTDFIQRHVSFVFEDLCRDVVRKNHSRVGFVPERVGRYWSKDTEVDIVAIDSLSMKAFVGECKYRKDRPVDRHVLNELRAKVFRIRDLIGYEITYGLFSISGFDESLENEDVLLFGPEDFKVQPC